MNTEHDSDYLEAEGRPSVGPLGPTNNFGFAAHCPTMVVRPTQSTHPVFMRRTFERWPRRRFAPPPGYLQRIDAAVESHAVACCWSWGVFV